MIYIRIFVSSVQIASYDVLFGMICDATTPAAAQSTAAEHQVQPNFGGSAEITYQVRSILYIYNHSSSNFEVGTMTESPVYGQQYFSAHTYLISTVHASLLPAACCLPLVGRHRPHLSYRPSF